MRFSSKNFRPSQAFQGFLDVGSFKTVCLIAKLDKKNLPERIVGVGISRSSGIRSGLIVDISAAQECIRKAVADAEKMAGVQLSEIDVALNCGNQKSQAFKISLSVASGTIDTATLSLLNQKAVDHAGSGRGYLVHINPVTYRLKGGSTATLKPVGLSSDALSGFFHAVTADFPAVTNLFQTLDRSYLSPDGVVPGALASALAVTEEDERSSGVIVIDIGSGLTNISAFTGGRFIFSETLSMGGGQVTLDIANVLRTPLEEAERIKTLYGTILCAPSNQYDIFTYMCRDGGEIGEQTATLSDLSRVIRSRVTVLLTLAYERLFHSGILNNFMGSIVLCGGSSKLRGITSLAETVFKSNVREGQPLPVSGLPPMLSSSEFSCVVGLLRARLENEKGVTLSAHSRKPALGYLSRVGQWIREAF